MMMPTPVRAIAASSDEIGEKQRFHCLSNIVWDARIVVVCHAVLSYSLNEVICKRTAYLLSICIACIDVGCWNARYVASIACQMLK